MDLLSLGLWRGIMQLGGGGHKYTGNVLWGGGGERDVLMVVVGMGGRGVEDRER
jgi:hypothetical protein